MKRRIEKELLLWKESPHRLPLILRGARQVGKTYTIEQFGRQNFSSFLSVNFELSPEYRKCFEQLEPRQILADLELIANQKITPGHTLLFLDEIQECPRAIIALRYFKEKLPQLHVIGAGSLLARISHQHSSRFGQTVLPGDKERPEGRVKLTLPRGYLKSDGETDGQSGRTVGEKCGLEFALHDDRYSYPVGRVQFMHLPPLSFEEFLLANDKQQLCEALKTTTISSPPSPIIHEHLLNLVRDYFFVGGMPAVINVYKDTHSLLQSGRMQSALIQTYKKDFGKYASKTQHKYLERFYEKAPPLITKHFQYTKIDSEMRARDLKLALEQLCHAGLVFQVFSSAANGLPLQATINEKKFKMLFLDIGLLQSALKVDIAASKEKQLHQINEGALAEQFVGQELLAYQDPYQERNLYFWERQKSTSSAEVDYITSFNATVTPIEVKAGSTGHLKSLHFFLQTKESKTGVRISKNSLSLDGKILSVPFYLIKELPRLMEGV